MFLRVGARKGEAKIAERSVRRKGGGLKKSEREGEMEEEEEEKNDEGEVQGKEVVEEMQGADRNFL